VRNMRYVLLLLCAATCAANADHKPGHSSAGGANDLAERVAALEELVATLSELLVGVSRLEDSNTGQDTLRFEDMNVQIVNGAANTQSATGTGNLIIGYNALRGDSECPDGHWCDRRGGSHNLVVGDGGNYTSWGGAVIGFWNESSGYFASVTGGANNRASGFLSSVSGGTSNEAAGPWSSISGGTLNDAIGDYSSVSGGSAREAEGLVCWEGGSTVDC
jgi:hypothetical protein